MTSKAEPYDGAGLMRRNALRLIPFLFIIYTIAYLDRVNVGFAQLQMKSALHLGDKAFGFGAGIFFLGYFCFEVPSNLILERVGARTWIARIMITWGIAAIAMIFTRSALSFYVLRFFLGVAEAGFFPGIILYLTYWFSASERARIISMFMTATAIANVIGSPISGALLGVHGWGLAGWQWLFILEGLPAIFLAFVVLAYLPDGPDHAPWLSVVEKKWVAERTRLEREAHPNRHGTLATAIQSPIVWLLAGVYFLLVMSMYGVALWLPQIVKGFGHLTNFQVGLITAVPYACAAVGMIFVGRSSDRRDERSLHVAIPAFVGGAGLLSAIVFYSPQVHSPILALLALSVAAMGMWATLGPFWALPPAFLSGTAAAGGIALINSVGNLGGFAGPYLVGTINAGRFDSAHHPDFSAGLLLLATTVVLGGILALFTRRKPAYLPVELPTQ